MELTEPSKSWMTRKQSVNIHDESQYSILHKCAIFVMAIIEAFLFSTILYGWSSLEYVYKQEGVYANLCTHNTTANSTSTGCSAQDEMFAIAYSVGAFTINFMIFPTGYFFDRFGLRITRLSASFMFVPGCLLLAFTSPDLPWLIFPGIFLLSSSHSILLTTLPHLSFMAAPHAGIVIGLITTAINNCIWVLVIVKELYEQGISYRISLTVLTGLWIIVIIDSLFLFPKMFAVPVKKESNLEDRGVYTIHDNPTFKFDDSNFQNGKQSPSEKLNGSAPHDETTTAKDNSQVKVDEPDGAMVTNEDLSLKHTLFCPEHLTLTFWFNINFLRFSFFLGSLYSWLAYITNNDSRLVNQYLTTLGFVQLADIFLSPAVGKLCDWGGSKLPVSATTLMQKATTMIVPQLLSPVTGLVLSLLIALSSQFMWDHAVVVPVAMFFYVVQRAGLFTTYYAYVGFVFPKQYYGSVVGMDFFTIALISLLQFPLILWTAQGHVAPNVLMLVLVAASFMHPLALRLRGNVKK